MLIETENRNCEYSDLNLEVHDNYFECIIQIQTPRKIQ